MKLWDWQLVDSTLLLNYQSNMDRVNMQLKVGKCTVLAPRTKNQKKRRKYVLGTDLTVFELLGHKLLD